MSEKLITHVGELLNEEKWTRATLNNYTVANFKELDEILDQIVEEEVQSEVVEMCDEHLQSSPPNQAQLRPSSGDTGQTHL